MSLPPPDAVIVRAYAPGDRAAVRALCADTADNGRPIDPVFPDRELIADLVTAYYTDHDPHWSWVAVADGRVVGYVQGCSDTRAWRWRTVWRIAPAAIARSIGRGILGRRQTWQFLRGLRWPAPGVPLAEYPAHLHVNVDARHRGRQVGRQLVAPFLAAARAAGVAGVHVSVSARNLNGQVFFTRLGFRPLTTGGRGRTVVLGLKLNEPG